MADTTFEDLNPNIPIVAAWLNDVNSAVYRGIFPTNAGIKGVINGSDAAVGVIGEYITGAGAVVGVASTAINNLTSIVLSPGDWEVSGSLSLIASSTAVISQYTAGASSVTASFGGFQSLINVFPAAFAQTGPISGTPTIRISTTTMITIYFVATVTFSPGTCTAQGSLRARRVR